MLESPLLIRWFISLIVIILLLGAFYMLLKIIKQKGYVKSLEKVDNRMRILEQFYLDSKNKIVKVKDGDKILTILVGASASFIKEEKIEPKLEQLENIKENNKDD
jgi:flagellar biogenesis protein FliO